MSKDIKKLAGEMEELGDPRQMRFQKKVEQELETIASLNGIEFAAAARIAARLGLQELKQSLGIANGKKKAA
jgi:hypothetical protein